MLSHLITSYNFGNVAIINAYLLTITFTEMNTGEYEEKRKRETDAHVGYIPEATVDQQPSERLEVTKPLSIPQGIDTELLKKLPPMPKGWKPGDPIPGLPKQQESKEVKQTKKAPPAPFSFALNPDMDIEFGVGESEESDSDDNE